MGWLFCEDSKKALIARRTRDVTGEKHERRCVAHCYRGNNYSGILWTVWALYADGNETDRYIGCDRLAYNKAAGWGQSWGYKDMEEGMGPCYYSCPLSYLDMVPPEKFPNSTNADWRIKVRKYHEKRSRKLTKGRRYKVVPGCTLAGVDIHYIEVETLKPLRGKFYSSSWDYLGRARFHRKQVAEEV